MSKLDRSRNSALITKGKIKESAGSATDNERLEADGIVDQLKGHLKQAGEKAKDAVKK